MCICICNLSNAFFSFVSDHNDFNFVSVFLYVCFFYRKVVCPCLSPVCFVCWCQDVKGYKRNVKKSKKEKFKRW